jgi:hypothetical protein
MAEDFFTVNAALGTTADTPVLTNSGSGKYIVILCQVANIDGSNSVNLYMDVYDSSATSAKALAHEIAIPADTSFNPIGGKLVLESSDELRAWTDVAADDLEINISYLEIT